MGLQLSTLGLCFTFNSEKLNNIILNKKLDESRTYEPKKESIKWENIMKITIEYNTFKDRGKSDLKQYLEEEKMYNCHNDIETVNEVEGKKIEIKKENSTKVVSKSSIHVNTSDIKLTKRFNIKKAGTPYEVPNIITQESIMEDNHTFVQYIVNVDGNNFKFVDVPGDGNCYFHCILKLPFLLEQFDSTNDIRSYLSQTVQLTYNNDPLLRKIFTKDRVDYNLWCLKILRDGEYAETFDQLVFLIFWNLMQL